MSRRNSIQYMFTFNNGSLSQDLSTRSIFIQLNKKNMSDDTFHPEKFMAKHRQDIIQELIGMIVKFKRSSQFIPPATKTRYLEWATWVNSVLIANGFTNFLTNNSEMTQKFDEKINLVLNTIIAKFEGTQLNLTAKKICESIAYRNFDLEGKLTAHAVWRILSPLLDSNISFHAFDGQKYEIKITKHSTKVGGNNSSYTFDIVPESTTALSVISVNTFKPKDDEKENTLSSFPTEQESPRFDHVNHDPFLEAHQISIPPNLFGG